MSADESGVLIEESRDGVRILRLNRPERKNALSDELGWGIVEAFERAAADDAVRVVGVTGEGDAFCSGVDLARGERRSPLTPDLGAHQREEMAYVHRGLSSEDGREAVRASLEKRKPEFQGR